MSAERRAPQTEKAIYINRARRPLSDILGCRIDADPTTPVLPDATVRGVTDVGGGGGGEIARLRRWWNGGRRRSIDGR